MNPNFKIDIIIQARLGSKRLPNKVLADLNGKSMFEFLIERLKKSTQVNNIFLATTTNRIDDLLVSNAKFLGLGVVRGSEDDVLSRFYDTSKKSNADAFIRVTGDCPFLDNYLLEDLINEFIAQKVDYLSNCNPPTLPDGLDLEIFNRRALEMANKNCKDKGQREHVTPWMRESKELLRGSLLYTKDMSNYRLTVDEPEDLILIREILSRFNYAANIRWDQIINLLRENPDLVKINSKFIRNEGSLMDQSQKLWRRAKKVIPGGNMLLSKRPEMFLPNKWPTYFSKSKGCNVWDIDNNKFVDMCLMGVGTNSLGYGREEIDEAVKKVINMGNLSSLNCPEEVLLAEKLIEIHPWAEMVRFARTGGEANAISIRIARAASSRDTVAICGYHGWHDWYLATNLKGDGLDEHLLSGLEPSGVPKGLSGSIKPFSFNNLEQIKNIANENDLAAIKMEVERSEPPTQEFLSGIRQLCDEKNIILIFDECTSGFRETYGGIHKKYNIEPDMAIFGKALGNGYAITAVIGKKNIMEAAQKTFISSTFWTERIGSVAALKTLEIMLKEKSWEQITNKGNLLRNIWLDISKKHNLNIKISGIRALSNFSFESNKNRQYKTLITQEMLKKGILASTSCYLCTEHSTKNFEDYSNNLDKIFTLISECENGKNVDDLLEYPLCHTGFERLN